MKPSLKTKFQGAGTLSEEEIKSAKQRISEMEKKQWHFIDGKDGGLSYSTKKDLVVSRKDRLLKALNQSLLEN